LNFSTAFSPCPNDAFIFHAITCGLIDLSGFKFESNIMDIDELNKSAFQERFDIVKISYHAYLLLKDKYALLDSGSALGYGCGPLLVSKDGKKLSSDSKIAIPGELTTAALLLKLWNSEFNNLTVLRFDEIMPAVASGEFDAGLIIHEGRFVFESYGLKKIIDLGSWWEGETGMPIPLGCIVIKNKYSQYVEKISSIIHSSIDYAFKNKSASRSYIKSLAQELDDKVIDDHINLYVNDFSRSLGKKGMDAVKKLEEMAIWRGLIK
jgi:1,4-dihydroxy-6-naphthoate synthase